MTENEDVAELLFFDTFSHEVDTDINLDLVQFPKPVYITQVRIIPLGARVQADFPGGVRLGATNPSKFDIEFFVNDLGMPGASTFENLGQLNYNQNDCIHLECTQDKIPTDGLVLRGWYSTITLAVYGILTNSLNEPIASPPPPPCEPTAPEEICNLSAAATVEGLDSGLAEDVLKEDWKEPLPGEAPHVHKNAIASDFERDDLEYGIGLREHYHQHSGDERERRLRKTSRSSERSVSSRNRTHSESNERDYVRARNDRERDKSTRDWSRSPEYGRRARRKRSERSRSEAEETHKWPRTPPATNIDSPTRPCSPDNMEYAEEDQEDVRYKLKSISYMHVSNESLVTAAQETLEDDEGTPGEQYEPILSDDELIGDDDSEQTAADEFEMELDAAAAAAEPAIMHFDAFRVPVVRYEGDLAAHCHKELDKLRQLFKKFETQTKCENSTSFKETTTSVEDRENFVCFGEQLVNQLAYLAQNLRQRNYVLEQLFQPEALHLQLAYGILETALDFDAACSQPQPALKIRHMKVGARLTELFGMSAEFLHYLLEVRHFAIFEAIFVLYRQDFMALSIKLMLLKAVYALLDTKVGLQHFLNAKLNGYQQLLEMLQQSHLTRTKYALQAIVKKLNLYEALECIHENCTKLFVLSTSPNSPDICREYYQQIEQAFGQLLDALLVNALSYQQPKRFLPVSKKFEIVADVSAQRCFGNALQIYFKLHGLAESLLLLFSNSSQLPQTLLVRAMDLLQAMLQTHMGVDYFVDGCFGTTEMLVAVLLGIEKISEPNVPQEATAAPISEAGLKLETPKMEVEGSEVDKIVITQLTDAPKLIPNSEVGLVQAEKLTPPSTLAVKSIKTEDIINTSAARIRQPQVLHRLQQLGVELAYKVQTRYHLDAIIYTATSLEYDIIKLATHLHALYSQTCSTPGRQYTIDVLGMNNNMQVFVDLIKKEQRLQVQRQLSSPGAKYKSPVLSYAVDLVDCCVRYCEDLDYLIEHGAKILDLAKNHETFEPSVSAVLQELFVYLKPLEAVNIFAYDDITPLVEVISRSLEYITTFPGDLIMGLRILRHLAIGPACKTYKSADTEQLKHRFVALQFYAADGMQILIQILEKLCSYFEQPGLHAPALMTIQGVHCCQIILPTLQILRSILSFAIHCRDVSFKDLTAIDHLMKSYFLMHYFPLASPAADEVVLAKQEIVQILLAYTQPNEQDEESLHKSLWTQMVREILKNIDGPSTFIPGLKVLSELLPLPLPMPLPGTTHLLEAQIQRLITERKLWSAHLHPQSAQIAKLIEIIAPSSFPQLSDLMSRVCLQLADLAPNMTLLVSRTISDLLCIEWSNAANAPTQPLARFLHFLARLTAYPSLKSSALSILSGKLWDIFQSVLTMTEFTELAFKCQLAVHRILENFLDADISLISPQSTSTPELNLASALPPKELIPRIVDALLTNLLNAQVTREVSALAVRNLVILTEHDITFYHLSLSLKHRSSDFRTWLLKIIQLNESGSYNSNIESLLLLLRALGQIEQHAAQPTTIPARTLKFSPSDLATLIGFQKACSESNVLQRIRAVFEQHKTGTNDSLLCDIDKLIAQLAAEDVCVVMDADEELAPTQEPLLPQNESIVTQYAARPIFMSYHAPVCDDVQLNTSHWLETICINSLSAADFETLYERIPCDLTELANACLPTESNLSTDCKRVLHLSASPQSNRERTPTAPCFRTRRVEVEPSTGRPEKKIYITPVRGRGFARAPPSRGDIFRSRPPNTSRPPSLHVDDFLALETCGAQPTGPTGYNKIPPLMRGSRVGRNRGSRIAAAAAYRKSKILRTSSPCTWNDSGSPHYRTATTEPHFGSDSHYSTSNHFGGRSRGRGSRSRPYIR